MKKTLSQIFIGSSPRTTIIGYAESAVIAAYPIFIDPNFQWKKDGVILLVAILRAVYGRFSKDSNGITAQQSQELHQEVKTLIEPTSSSLKSQ